MWSSWSGHSCAPPSWAGNLGGGSCLTSSRGTPGGFRSCPHNPQGVTSSGQSFKNIHSTDLSNSLRAQTLTTQQPQTQTQTQSQEVSTQSQPEENTQTQTHTQENAPPQQSNDDKSQPITCIITDKAIPQCSRLYVYIYKYKRKKPAANTVPSVVTRVSRGRN